jgi:hypothetical protein
MTAVGCMQMKQMNADTKNIGSPTETGVTEGGRRPTGVSPVSAREKLTIIDSQVHVLPKRMVIINRGDGKHGRNKPAAEGFQHVTIVIVHHFNTGIFTPAHSRTAATRCSPITIPGSFNGKPPLVKPFSRNVMR